MKIAWLNVNSQAIFMLYATDFYLSDIFLLM